MWIILAAVLSEKKKGISKNKEGRKGTYDVPRFFATVDISEEFTELRSGKRLCFVVSIHDLVFQRCFELFFVVRVPPAL
jgi:hypothetical protein